MNNAYMLFQGKVSDTHLIVIKSELDKAEAAGKRPDLTLTATALKSPMVGLVLGFLFGWLGVDRFYKGDVGLGILKIILCIAPMFFAVQAGQRGDEDLAAMAMMIGFASLIWCIADLFLVYTGIKKDNFNKIIISL